MHRVPAALVLAAILSGCGHLASVLPQAGGNDPMRMTVEQYAMARAGLPYRKHACKRPSIKRPAAFDTRRQAR